MTPPGSTAAIREARLSGDYWALVFMSGAVYLYEDFELAEKIGNSLTHQMKPQRVRLASLSPEAAPVPAAMPQIEVGDEVLLHHWCAFERDDVAATVEHGADNTSIQAIKRNGVVIWRRAEAP